jgi:hypothetical protein
LIESGDQRRPDRPWSTRSVESKNETATGTYEFAQAIRIDTQRRVALISDSALVRGTITAIEWFTRANTAAFAARDARRALDYLAADIAFDRMRAERVLDEITGAVQVRILKSS